MDNENLPPNAEAEKQVKRASKCLVNWLRILQETTKMRDGETLTPEKIKSYILVLADIPFEPLERGLRRSAKECTFFPTTAEIRERCENRQLAAEQQWQLAERIFDRHWHPDIGLHSNPPAFDPAGEYAMRQIGGFPSIASTERQHVGFVRDRFLAAYTRYQAEGGEQTRLTQALAEQALLELRSARETKQLPAETEAVTAENKQPNRETKPTKTETFTIADYDARMRALREQAARLGVVCKL